MEGDTIVAVSTPRGAAARGVVRLSGPRAVALAAAAFVPGAGQPSLETLGRGLSDGAWRLGDGLSSARATVFRAPRSATGEDVVELHLPGSPALLEAVVLACAAAGARPAGPGEFTRRAFLNGRIDLTRAEAVLALIHARDGQERRAAVAALEGGLARRLAVERDRILAVLVPLELGLDFSDQDVAIPLPWEAGDSLARAAGSLDDLAARAVPAAAERSAFRVVLSGPANAGKSSLFNRLAGRDAAIVSSERGTTRDVVTAEIPLGDLRVLLADTAGEDFEAGEADRAAQVQRRRRLADADLVVEVRDGRRAEGPPPPDRIGVRTHADLLPPDSPTPPGCLRVDNLGGAGIADVRAALVERLVALRRGTAGAPLSVNARQAAALRTAAAAIRRAIGQLAADGPAELAAADLRAALSALGDVTGEEVAPAVLDRIFAGFCIGK